MTHTLCPLLYDIALVLDLALPTLPLPGLYPLLCPTTHWFPHGHLYGPLTFALQFGYLPYRIAILHAFTFALPHRHTAAFFTFLLAILVAHAPFWFTYLRYPFAVGLRVPIAFCHYTLPWDLTLVTTFITYVVADLVLV